MRIIISESLIFHGYIFGRKYQGPDRNKGGDRCIERLDMDIILFLVFISFVNAYFNNERHNVPLHFMTGAYHNGPKFKHQPPSDTG